MRDVRAADGQVLSVAAAVNPDYFLNFYGNHLPAGEGVVQLLRYDGLLLAGGHAPGMKEYLESTVLQSLVARHDAARKPWGAVCHGRGGRKGPSLRTAEIGAAARHKQGELNQGGTPSHAWE